jgi:hypothetical protein
MAAYVLEGPRWGTGVAGTGGGTVSWAADSSVPATFVSDIKAAFADWSAHASISFQQIDSAAGAQIRFSSSYIDGLNNVLGHTDYTYSGQSFISANVTFDNSEGWHTSGSQIVSSGGVDVFVLALHEIGHALGLGHYDSTPTVMNAYLSLSVTDLSASDISGIQALYGAPMTTEVVSTTSATPTIGTTMGSAASGTNVFGTFAHDAASRGSEIYALYDALLGRAPDPLGMEGWANALNHGLSVRDMTQAFLASPEGQARAGALDNAAFVEQLYGSTLHRHSDAAGLQGWTNTLAQGASRADVALGFALSPEHLANIQGALDTGVFVPDANAAAAARLYYGILDRAPDAAGLAGWTSAVQQGTSLTSIAQQFLASPEAQAKFAGVSDAMFVSNLYDNALGRAADASGLQGWMNALQHGTSHADVAVQISESQEAQVHLVGQIETGWHLI